MTAPNLTWTLNGEEATPVPLREIASARPANLVGPQTPRAFTGVYEFQCVRPDTEYQVEVTAENLRKCLKARTLPSKVPVDLTRSFNVLLVSCFHQSQDRKGVAGQVVSGLKGCQKPHLTILAGDQVYLDLPTLMDFSNNVKWLSNRFESDYVKNWGCPQGYERVLQAAPSVAVPDDHEFWNNYPHPAPFIQNSWSNKGRKNWCQAARLMYEAFQMPAADGSGGPFFLGDSFELDVPPLSFFLADTRTHRNKDRANVLSACALEQLEAWSARVSRDSSLRVGVFVSGQPLLAKPAGWFWGHVTDFTLPNYQDYKKIVSNLLRIVDSGRSLMCLTGDVHWGRVAVGTDTNSNRNRLTEVISSPTSLVETVLFDQLKSVKGAIWSFFGQDDPWPRHPDPSNAPKKFPPCATRFLVETRHMQRGNQATLLSFTDIGNTVKCRIKYWPLTLDQRLRKPREVGPITLR